MLVALTQAQELNLRLTVTLKMQNMILTYCRVILGRGGQSQSMMSMNRTELEEDTLHWGLVSQEIMLFHKEMLAACIDLWFHGSMHMTDLSIV
jgi:hypothetical protein